MADSAARVLDPMTVEQFLAFCSTLPAGEKWELHDGRPVMMVGGTVAHGIIAGNIARALFEPARRMNCRPMTGLLVQASANSLFEPDVAIFCGALDPQSRVSSEPRSGNPARPHPASTSPGCQFSHPGRRSRRAA